MRGLRRSVIAALCLALVLPGASTSITLAGNFPGATACDPGDDDQGHADQILADQLQLPGYPAVALPHDPTWSEDPLASLNWQVNLHTLWWVLWLVNDGRPEALDRALELTHDWLEDNPTTEPPSEFSWYDHPTGVRSIVLVCLAEAVASVPDWLAAGIALHESVLAEKYTAVGNHALMQNLGLLELACYLEDGDRIDLARARIETLLAESVNEKGVSVEQAPAYELFNYQLYTFARERLIACGQPVAAEFERVDRMPRVLAQMTRPDGQYEQIGDTRAGPAEAIAGTVAEYAATNGASGPKPRSEFGVYRAGYAFGRTGWAADDAFFSLRFGPQRFIHGHEDGTAVTLHGDGAPLIVDASNKDYNRDAWRTYFKSRRAHNTVVQVGAATLRTETELLRHRRTDSVFELLVRQQPYEGVTLTRRVIFSRGLGYLVIEDRVTSEKPHTFMQLWHLRPGVLPIVKRSRVVTKGNHGDVAIVQLLPTGVTSIMEGGTDPIQGWVGGPDIGTREPAPVVQQTANGRELRFITLLVPGGLAQVSGLAWGRKSFRFEIDVRGDRESVVADPKRATVTPLSGTSAAH